MEWIVDRPERLITAEVEATLERLGVERITGWAKRERGGLEVTAGAPAPEYQRVVIVGPRGGVRSDTHVDFMAKRAAREQQKAAAERRAEREASGSLGVYSRDGTLIGLRLG